MGQPHVETTKTEPPYARLPSDAPTSARENEVRTSLSMRIASGSQFQGTATTSLPSPLPAATTVLVDVRKTLSQPVVASFMAGGVAGAVSRTVVSPLERLKILFQIQSAGREDYKLGVGKALSKMWREEGWKGFMRGNGTNCIRIVPYSAVQFGSYNFYKRVRQAPCARDTHDYTD